MEVHISTTCSVLFPNNTKHKNLNATPICHAKKCGTKMVVPILCKNCKERFCFKHRFEGDHGCVPIVVVGKKVAVGKGKAVVVGGGGGLKKVVSRGSTSMNAVASSSKSSPPIAKPNATPKPLVTKSNSKSSTSQSTAASIAASAAEARLLSSTSTSFSTNNNNNKKGSGLALGTKSNPIIISDSSDEESEKVESKILSGPKRALIALTPATKIDKRSAQERISARRALEMRASRG